MTNPPTTQTQYKFLEQKETDALNKHGLFFKKKVLHELAKVPGLTIISEELGVSFGSTRVIDIVAVNQQASPALFYVFECKRAYTAEKRWFFFEDILRTFRVFRERTGSTVTPGLFSDSAKMGISVCSEGYEYTKSDGKVLTGDGKGKANQDPVFSAAAQLASGFLGFIQRRLRDDYARTATHDRYVPVLVTTAELALVEYDVHKIAIEDGNLPQNPPFYSKPFLVLQHPFPTPEGIGEDPRDKCSPPSIDLWYHHHKESLYVVTASALSDFMRLDLRNARLPG